MKHDELIQHLRGCDGCRCRDCELKDEYFCNPILMEKAADVIEELQKPKWIPVRERLPKDGEFVLVCNDDGHMMIAKYESETLDWFHKYTNYDFDIWDNEEQGPVLYWMPLPEPPEDGV